MEFKLKLLCICLNIGFCMGERLKEADLWDANGDIVYVTTGTDHQCNFQIFTSVVEENVHIVINDFSDDLSVVLFSENNDVCYFRNLTEEEEEDARNCVNGTITLKKEALKTRETLYDFGEEVDLQTLPTKVQKLCGNRKAVALHAIRPTQMPGDADQPKGKRLCRTTMSITRSMGCRMVCPFWMCRQLCNISLRPLTKAGCQGLI